MRRGRGRPPLKVVKVSMELQLPVDVASWINEQTYDPRTGRAKYGARNDLIERLVRDEMQRQQVENFQLSGD